MKYPIDAQTTETFFGHLIAHDRAQRKMIEALNQLLVLAMEHDGEDSTGEMARDTQWFREAKKLFAIQKQTKMDHDNRQFNARNGHQDNTVISIDAPGPVPTEKIEHPIHVGGTTITPEVDAKLNEFEANEFGGEMSEEELASHFREKPKREFRQAVDLAKKEPFKGMTLQEIEDWEARQDNANDLFKVKARVKNAVSGTGGALTAVGEMMVNSFVHVAKDLYDFADTIQDKELRIRLIERVRKHESMPATLIAAVASGVNVGRPGPKK